MSEPSRPVLDAAADRDRKAEHIALALEDRMQVRLHHFERWRLVHAALPEIDLADVDTRTCMLALDVTTILSVFSGNNPDGASL